MRLQTKEVNAIAQAAQDAFTPGTAVFLFGSRVDDPQHRDSMRAGPPRLGLRSVD